MGKTFKDYSIEDIESLFSSLSFPRFRTLQVLDWVYTKHASSFQDMTNLPKAMRDQLETILPLNQAVIANRLISQDETRKYVIRFQDDTIVETVGLPSEDGRLTVCCSSQSGCAMGCRFCATGKMGLARSLGPGEIVDQVLIVQNDFQKPVTNVVVMGQGEPFANYDNTIAALRIMNHPKLLSIGARHITISTCGLTRGIERLSCEPEQFTLAISLHAAVQEKRDYLMPAMKNISLFQLKDVLNQYVQKTNRRVSFEYALMKDVNDSKDDLSSLISFCKGILCHVNLIPLNEIEESPFKPVSSSVMHYWESQLQKEGIPSSIRKSRGSDISGACGQLAHVLSKATI